MATTYSGLWEERIRVCRYQTLSSFKLLTYRVALWSFKTSLPTLPGERHTYLPLIIIITIIFLRRRQKWKR
jgi:hypothetical protein